MHSASVNSEPGSNSPLIWLGGFPRVKESRYYRLRPKWRRIDSSLHYLLSCQPVGSFTRRSTQKASTPISLTPSPQGIREQGVHSLAKKLLSKSKNLSHASCLLLKKQGGKFTLPSAGICRFLPDLNMIAQRAKTCQAFF